MKLSHQNTPSALSHFIGEIRRVSYSWRMISIEFQDSETLHSDLFQKLCYQNLTDCFEPLDGEIFWFRPGLVLIFFQGRPLPIEKAVEVFLRATEFQGLGRFFDILDLSIDWHAFTALTDKLIPRLSVKEPAPIIVDIVDHVDPPEPPPKAHFEVQLSAEKISQTRRSRGLSRIKPVVLLVEDDSFIQQLFKLALSDHDVICAETSRQALAFYQRHAPDIAFLDINLPDGDGLSILRKISEADAHAYCVMLSGNTQKEKIMASSSLGAKTFIGKPFTRQRLLDVMADFLTFWRKQTHVA